PGARPRWESCRTLRACVGVGRKGEEIADALSKTSPPRKKRQLTIFTKTADQAAAQSCKNPRRSAGCMPQAIQRRAAEPTAHRQARRGEACSIGKRSPDHCTNRYPDVLAAPVRLLLRNSRP